MLISQPVSSSLTNHSACSITNHVGFLFIDQRRPSFGFESSVSSTPMTSGDPVIIPTITIIMLITHRRSVAKRDGYFQRRLFVCQCVCLSARLTSERLNVGRSNLAVRYIVQKSRPSSKVKVKGQRSRSPGTKNEKLLSHPIDNA